VDRLPIDDVLPELRTALRRGTAAVLQAPPGAGKTTRVPLALLDEPWLAGGRIIVLEPRRLAARAAARHMARLLGEREGGTVGYRIRLDTRVSERTRIEVVTEGVLTRLLQADPALEGVGLVVFDEFHERSLHADLALALCLETRALLRPELRLLVMSATLEGDEVAAMLDGAPIITSQGRQHPVETRYLERPVDGPVEAAVARTVLAALARDAGDVLAFLPGQAEIRRTAARLAGALPAGGSVAVLPLYGDLPAEAQDRAIRPVPPGTRKVVLATSIAETSLTIEGVGIVVDAGLARVPRFSPRTGLTRLETVRVSRAAADQRRGRAGRLGPGVCYRLWTAAEHRTLRPHALPEVLEADLAPLALELAVWGAPDPTALRWLDPPPAAAFSQARELLGRLGALDGAGAITPHGREMAALGLHPRLAHMLLCAGAMGAGATACLLAALLDERDILHGDAGPPDADLRLRLEVLRAAAAGRCPASIAGFAVDRAAVHRALAQADLLARRAGVSPGTTAVDDAGLLLAFAYPDRLARARAGSPGRFVLRNGRGAALAGPTPLVAAEWIVAADVDDRGRESRIFRAAPIAREEIEAHFAGHIRVEQEVAWDGEAVRAMRRERLDALVLRETSVADPDPEAVADALLAAILREGLASLPWSREASRLRERLGFLHRLEPEAWPDVSEAALAASATQWLRPHLYGVRTRAELQRLDLQAILIGLVPPGARRRLDEWAPTHLVVPSGSRIPIDYADPDAPVLAVRIQELFGLRETPRIAGGRVPLTLHLLSPAHRPVQVTRDLASFWRDAYFEVRKDLRGRYPKHPWPDDPLTAPPTRRARR